MELLPQKEPNKRVVRIHFPDKAANQPEGVSYAYEYRMEKGFLMTREEAAVAYAGESPETEAFYHKNDISTRLLLIDLSFPRGYSARVSAVALVNNEVHVRATQELKVEENGNRFSLAVKKPLQGFEYMLTWEAPSAEDFAKQKALAKGGNEVK
jgi:methionine-rich copper-binding protein CopC